jgi:biopolymer transport protein ExbD
MDKTTNTIRQLLSVKGVFSLFDVLFVMVMFFYIIYAFLITRQIKLLNKSFSTPSATFLSQAAFAHFLLAIAVTFMALISL